GAQVGGQGAGGRADPTGRPLMGPVPRLGPGICGDLDHAARQEWLVTDGLGGFAMGTAAGLRARRYHGLLVVANRPPPGRHLGLEMSALCAWRDQHSDRFAGPGPTVEQSVDGFTFERAYRVAGPGFEPAGGWFRGVRYRVEAERGLGDGDDLWHAGTFHAPL